MKTRKYINVLILLLLVPVFTINVHAEERECKNKDDSVIVTTDVCHNGYVYSVAYDKCKNTNVSIDKIFRAVGTNGFVNNKNKGFVGTEDVANEYSAINVGTKCYNSSITDTEITYSSCPSFNLSAIYLNETIDKETKLVTPKSNLVEYKITGETYQVKIKVPNTLKPSGSKNFNVKIRLVRDGMPKIQDEVAKNPTADATVFDAREYVTGNAGNSNWITFKDVKVTKDDGTGRTAIPVRFEFYDNNEGPCKNNPIGSFIFYLPDIDENIEKNNKKGSTLCNQVRNMVNKAEKEKKLSTIAKDAQEIVPWCYANTLKHKELKNFDSLVSKGIKDLQIYIDSFVGTTYKEKTGYDQSKCDDKLTFTKDLGSVHDGTYWRTACYETYEAQGSKPILVKAGKGFAYKTVFTVTRHCSIIQKSKPSKDPLCQKDVSCNCHWVGVTGIHHDGQFAGPSLTFDNCVKECDGGKYSQKCINSCYSQVYGKKRDLSLINKITEQKQENNFKQMGGCSGETYSYDVDSRTMVPTGRTVTDQGKPADLYELDGVSCGVSDWCDGHGYSCIFHVSVGPSGCSWCPESEYQARLSNSWSDLKDAEAAASRVLDETSTGTYTYVITDAETGQKFVVDSNNHPKLGKSVNQGSLSTNSANACLGNDSPNRCVDYWQTADRTTTITLQLPYSYVDKLTNRGTYSSASEQPELYQFISVNNDKNLSKLNVSTYKSKYYSKFDKSQYYYNVGERKYYTSLFSLNTNVYFEGKIAKLVGYNDVGNWNIMVTADNVGYSNFKSQIKCYYGVGTQPTCSDCCVDDPNTPKNECCVDDPTTPENDCCDPRYEVCPDSEPGIQYIFRPIVLADVFPNERSPRYNWTDKAKISANAKNNVYKNQDIDPVALTEKIENDGATIYDNPSELDYEFILTPSLIRKIKDYNDEIEEGKADTDFNDDGYNNYLDYDLNCNVSNSSLKTSVCSSRFLDEVVEYNAGGRFDINGRQKLIGCNNSLDGECVLYNAKK